jgi:hypothetical protein
VATTVELLGSWDNFTKPYRLERDHRRGHGIWSGCYTFDGIICDGDMAQLGPKRDGPLKMGGTYWYYYKVDDEETHNASEPSTTHCPLLPGQKLNVLDVPVETRSRSSSESLKVFTQNPQDKYRPPVPPKDPSSRLGGLCTETYTVPMHNLASSRSYTYPLPNKTTPNGIHRHASSASRSPQCTPTLVLNEFKGLKEKLATRGTRSGSTKDIQEMQIGNPTLVSTTAEDIRIVPLPGRPSPPPPPPLPSTSPAVHNLQPAHVLPPAISAKIQEFSALGSHPVNPVNDLNIVMPTGAQSQTGRYRSRSETPKTAPVEMPALLSGMRANSSETRRTKVFCNEPWVASPALSQQVMKAPPQEPPALLRSWLSSESSFQDARPTSSYGGDRSSCLRKLPFDKNKKLPEIPESFSPAPFLLSSTTREKVEENRTQDNESLHVRVDSEQSSHFSLWSEDSTAFSSPTSEDDPARSPTLSYSSCSEVEFPTQRSTRPSIIQEDESEEEESDLDDDLEEPRTSTISADPPRLSDFRLSAFGSTLFSLDLQDLETTPNRQAACIGLGFQGYQLPENETASKTTLTESRISSGRVVRHDRESSTTQMDNLGDDFRFLGHSVHQI